MKCPKCGFEIPKAKLNVREAASALGSIGRGATKARDSDKMSAAGKLGGRPKGWRKKKSKSAAKKASK
jgi:hypothetical protein